MFENELETFAFGHRFANFYNLNILSSFWGQLFFLFRIFLNKFKIQTKGLKKKLKKLNKTFDSIKRLKYNMG